MEKVLLTVMTVIGNGNGFCGIVFAERGSLLLLSGCPGRLQVGAGKSWVSFLLMRMALSANGNGKQLL